MNLSDFTKTASIDKGWSGDRKLRVTDRDGVSYLLRIVPEEKYSAKAAEFELMQRVSALGVPMCRPVGFGRCDEGVYTLIEWIEGEDAENVVSKLSDADAYQYGIDAGKHLHTIHTLPAPEDAEPWSVRYGRKIDRKLKMYDECPLKYDNGELFVDFLHTSRHLIAERPQTMHHGDYHIGNMMVDNSGRLIVIDFDRHDFGDPWEEFNRIVWCVQCSHAFASGMVDGYFDGNAPEAFWRLLALYMANNTLSSLPWAIPYGQKQINIMRDQAAELLEWYDGFKRVLPTWYVGAAK